MIYLIRAFTYSTAFSYILKKEKVNNLLTIILVAFTYFLISLVFKTIFPFDLLRSGIGIILGFILSCMFVEEEFTIKSLKEPFYVFLIYFGMSSVEDSLFTILKPKISSLNQLLILSTILSIITISILVFYYKDELKKQLKDFINNFLNYFDFGFSIYFLGLLGMVVFNLLIMKFVNVATPNNEDYVQTLIKASPFIMLFQTSIIAPIQEELVFRLSFLKTFKKKYVYVIMSGLIFGLAHVIFSYNSLIDFVYVLPYATLGAAFAYMSVKHDNVFIGMMFHFLHNFILTTVSLLPLLIGVIYG